MRAPTHPCAVCLRPSLGFGWFDASGLKPPRPQANFCSMSCQTLWTWLAARSLSVVDFSEHEQSAIRTAMKSVAEIFEEIGWDTKLADLTEHQVLTLIEVAIGGFRDAMHAMAAHHAHPEIPF